MARRQVTRSGKDANGDIIKLCNPATGWSPRSKNDAIYDIVNALHSYYLTVDGTEDVGIHVIDDPDRGKYLKTDPEYSSVNNLDNLPDC